MTAGCTKKSLHYSDFSTGVLQECLKHAVSDYLGRDTGLFSLRLSNLKMTTANTTTAINTNESKVYGFSFFFVRLAKKMYFGVCTEFY